MFWGLKLGPQDSLLSNVFVNSRTRFHFVERRGGGGGVNVLIEVCL